MTWSAALPIDPRGERPQGGVQEIHFSLDACAAVKRDGSVVTWGNDHIGGDSSAVREQLRGGVQHVCSTDSTFAVAHGARKMWVATARG